MISLKILFILGLIPLLTIPVFAGESKTESPYKLFESGWEIYEIDCIGNMEKLVNLHGKPICVFPASSSKLIEKGYAVPFERTEDGPDRE